MASICSRVMGLRFSSRAGAAKGAFRAGPIRSRFGANGPGAERPAAIRRDRRPSRQFARPSATRKCSCGRRSRSRAAPRPRSSSAARAPARLTLLRLIVALDRPTTGDIFIDGENIAKMGENELNRIRKKFGMVYQYAALLDSICVFDNVAFPLVEHTKLSKKEISERRDGASSRSSGSIPRSSRRSSRPSSPAVCASASASRARSCSSRRSSCTTSPRWSRSADEPPRRRPDRRDAPALRRDEPRHLARHRELLSDRPPGGPPHQRQRVRASGHARLARSKGDSEIAREFIKNSGVDDSARSRSRDYDARRSADRGDSCTRNMEALAERKLRPREWDVRYGAGSPVPSGRTASWRTGAVRHRSTCTRPIAGILNEMMTPFRPHGAPPGIRPDGLRHWPGQGHAGHGKRPGTRATDNGRGECLARTPASARLAPAMPLTRPCRPYACPRTPSLACRRRR